MTRIVLPGDILDLICRELSDQDDFPTLLECALAGRQLAPSAFRGLYRAHYRSPVIGGNEALPIAQQELVVQKWSILWRSIILSSVQDRSRGTLFPYCRYIKVLDLRDLSNLLEDDKFRGKIAHHFFSGELSRFKLQIVRVNSPPPKKGQRPMSMDRGAQVPSLRGSQQRLDIMSIVNKIGEAIISYAPTLEQLFPHLSPASLVHWAPKLPRLRRLELWDGETLAQAEVREALHKHCPHLNALSIYMWTNEKSDALLAAFLNGLRPQVLSSFRTISSSHIAGESFIALSRHGASLRELRLTELSNDALIALSSLRGCTSLETLELNDKEGSLDLEATHNDVFLEVMTWLSTCTRLKQLMISRFVSGPATLLPILMSDNVRLHKVELNGYLVRDHRDFHLALSNQRSLQSLFLKGDSDGIIRDDIDILIDSLVKLEELKELRLGGVSEYFRDEHIISIVQNLVKLEELYIGGFGITDAVLGSSSGALRNLRSVCFMGMTSFTAAGLLQFISELGPGNQGLLMSVDSASVEGRLSEEKQVLVRDALARKVGGRFEYQLWRDPDISEYEGSDSD